MYLIYLYLYIIWNCFFFFGFLFDVCNLYYIEYIYFRLRLYIHARSHNIGR